MKDRIYDFLLSVPGAVYVITLALLTLFGMFVWEWLS